MSKRTYCCGKIFNGTWCKKKRKINGKWFSIIKRIIQKKKPYKFNKKKKKKKLKKKKKKKVTLI